MKYLLFSISFFWAVDLQAQVSHHPDSVSNGQVYVYVEHMPVSQYDLGAYLSTNLHYPKKAREKNIEGRVLVKFVVNEDGHISDCEITKGVSKELDEEALRVVKNMPPWKPGIQNGKAVKVYFTLPIVYKLED